MAYLWPVYQWVLPVVETRARALRLASLAFLGQLLLVLASGKELVDYEAPGVLWAVLIPLGVLIIVVGLPAALPGEYQPRRLAVGAIVYAAVGAFAGYVVWQAADTDGSKLFQTHEAVIAGFAWPVTPFLWMLQAMHDGLGWYS